MISRRQWLKATVGAVGAGLATDLMAGCPITAINGRGPFYPDTPIPAVVDLTQGGKARGAAIYVFGRVLDEDCQPLAGADIAIWQCDSEGRYKHGRSRSEALDPAFAYCSRALCEGDGVYFFKTLQPVTYGSPGFQRAPHIHFLVRKRGYRELATEMHFSGPSFDKIRDRDDVFQAIPKHQHETVIVTRKPTSDFPEHADRFSGEAPCCQFDLVLRKA